MTLLHFPGHVLLGSRLAPCRCTQRRDDGRACFVCEGGLALCVVCGGVEGSMPTHCPGHVMPDCVQDAVYAGEVDYVAQCGWVQCETKFGTGKRTC